ncbi:MAG: hypothetical protein RL115_784 [Bacteroidota bacterium]
MQYLFIIVFLTLVGCAGDNGIIESRDHNCEGVLNSKRVFIVNKSKKEKYKFTVKRIEIINDTIKKYSTKIIELEPGNEEDLGCELYYSDQKYLSIEKIKILKEDTVYKKGNIIYTKDEIKKIVEMNKETSYNQYITQNKLEMLPLIEVTKSKLYDTLINNISKKYYKYETFDSTKIVNQKKHILQYKITGYVAIKDKVK